MTKLPDPTQCVYDLHAAARRVAAAMEGDVVVDTDQVLPHLVGSLMQIRDACELLADAAVTVDRAAAAELRGAQEDLRRTAGHLGEAFRHLPHARRRRVRL